jgi:hypothetical protein
MLLLGEVLEVLDEPTGSPHAYTEVVLLEVVLIGFGGGGGPRTVIFIEEVQLLEKLLIETALTVK